MCHTAPTLNGEWADWRREMWYKKQTSVHTSHGLSLSLTLVLGVVAHHQHSTLYQPSLWREMMHRYMTVGSNIDTLLSNSIFNE